MPAPPFEFRRGIRESTRIYAREYQYGIGKSKEPENLLRYPAGSEDTGTVSRP